MHIINNRKVVIFSFIVALTIISAWWIFGGLLQGWLFTLYAPSLYLTLIISGNPHNPNAVIGFISQVIQTFVMVYIIFVSYFYILKSLKVKSNANKNT